MELWAWACDAWAVAFRVSDALYMGDIIFGHCAD
jgi:hypothetical protein